MAHFGAKMTRDEAYLLENGYDHLPKDTEIRLVKTFWPDGCVAPKDVRVGYMQLLAHGDWFERGDPFSCADEENGWLQNMLEASPEYLDPYAFVAKREDDERESEEVKEVKAAEAAKRELADIKATNLALVKAINVPKLIWGVAITIQYRL